MQSQHITKTHQCQDRDLTKNHIDSVSVTETIYNGLKGGAPKIKKPPKKSDQLQLRNGGTEQCESTYEKNRLYDLHKGSFSTTSKRIAC